MNTKTPAKRTTTRRSVTVAAEQTTLVEEVDALPGRRRTYVIESHSFAARLEQDRRDRLIELTRIETEMQDIAARIGQLQAEFEARADHLADVQNIVDQINAALAVGPRQVPTQPARLAHKEGMPS